MKKKKNKKKLLAASTNVLISANTADRGVWIERLSLFAVVYIDLQ